MNIRNANTIRVIISIITIIIIIIIIVVISQIMHQVMSLGPQSAYLRNGFRSSNEVL